MPTPFGCVLFWFFFFLVNDSGGLGSRLFRREQRKSRDQEPPPPPPPPSTSLQVVSPIDPLFSCPNQPRKPLSSLPPSLPPSHFHPSQQPTTKSSSDLYPATGSPPIRASPPPASPSPPYRNYVGTDTKTHFRQDPEDGRMWEIWTEPKVRPTYQL